VLLIDIKGAIGFVSAAHLARAVDKAKAQEARALIVRLDTPGGLLSSTREMIQTILGSPVPIIMYVAPGGARAASAGTYLMYAAHVAAMAPGTHLGAATPIPLGAPGLPGAPPTKQEKDKEKGSDGDPAGASAHKVLNDAVAYIRSLAQLRGRNAEWAEKAVREASTLTSSEALKENVIDLIATEVPGLLSSSDGRQVKTASGETRLETRGRTVTVLEPDWKMQLLSAITDPNIAFILLMIGIYGLLFEFWSPGAIVPGVVGGISLLVALTALSVLPVNFGGLGLLLLGVALMLVEILNPGFGALGVGGAAAFALGALFLFDPSETDIRFQVSPMLIITMTVLSIAFFAGVLAMALKARRRPVQTGGEEMIGMPGEVVSWSGDEGRIRVHSEIWNARSEQPLNKGQRVVVASRSGLTLTVKAIR
jgi:membrane-bound serine protease (ClpP class)